MNSFRKLALAGLGLAFVLGLAVTESNAQWGGRHNRNRGYDRGYVRSQPRLSVTFSTGHSYGRGYNSYYGRNSYGRSYNSYYGRTPYGPSYNSYYGGGSYNRGGYGLSWHERRILAMRRARAIGAMNRYQRTRARILNRNAYRNSYYGDPYYRNW